MLQNRSYRVTLLNHNYLIILLNHSYPIIVLNRPSWRREPHMIQSRRVQASIKCPIKRGSRKLTRISTLRSKRDTKNRMQLSSCRQRLGESGNRTTNYAGKS